MNILESFDRVVFESVDEKIVIGGYNDQGVEEPLKITLCIKLVSTPILMERVLSQSVKTLRLYIMTQNCVFIRVTRLKNCVYIVAPVHVESVFVSIYFVT